MCCCQGGPVMIGAGAWSSARWLPVFPEVTSAAEQSASVRSNVHHIGSYDFQSIAGYLHCHFPEQFGWG